MLFNIFINHLAQQIIELKRGLKLTDQSSAAYSAARSQLLEISLLLYADDIVLLADNPDDLQAMLDTLYEHSRKWR